MGEPTINGYADNYIAYDYRSPFMMAINAFGSLSTNPLIWECLRMEEPGDTIGWWHDN